MRCGSLQLVATFVVAAACIYGGLHAESSNRTRQGAPSSIALPSAEQPTTLLALLRDYEKLTGQRFVMHEATHAHLKKTEVSLEEAHEIPRDAVHSVIGTLLEMNSIALTVLLDQEPRVLELHDFSTTNPAVFFEPANHIRPDQLDEYAELPASAVSTTLFLEHLDAFQVASHLVRPRLAETDECFAVGDHSLVLAGYAFELRQIFRALRVADERQGLLGESAGELARACERRRARVQLVRNQLKDRIRRIKETRFPKRAREKHLERARRLREARRIR